MRHQHLLLLLLACTPEPYDADLDLLPLTTELEIGTDPDRADSDGDGLSDGMEVHVHLTDPTRADSDGDGEHDGWELSVGLDPLDDKARRYPNGWPHQPVTVKQELQRTKAPSVVEIGRRIREFVLPEQGGQDVDLYDFARAGKPVVVMECSLGCVVRWSDWIEFGGPVLAIGNPSEAVREAVTNDRIRVIVSLTEDRDAPPSKMSLEVLEGSDVVIRPETPLLLDQGFTLWGHLGRRDLGVPEPGDRDGNGSFVVLDEDMVVRGINDWQVALDLIDL
jgi:hypothetical protein